MPRRPEQNEAIRQAQRQAILKVALPLFAKGGIDGTPVSQIAKAAGVAHGTVFLYFPTKVELAASVLSENLGLFQEEFVAMLRTDASPLDRIKRFVRLSLESALHQADLVLLAAHVDSQRERFPTLTPQIHAFSDVIIGELAKVIEEGQSAGELGPGNPQATAVCFFALLQGIPLLYEGPTGQHPFWNELLERAMRLFGPVTAQ